MLQNLWCFTRKNIFIFLAQDGEYIYDLARILFTDNPEQLKKYRAVIVDNGLLGTISENIQAQFPDITGERIPTHFILSGNPTMPLTRIFLQTFNPFLDATSNLASYETDVLVHFENLPHYTLRQFNGLKIFQQIWSWLSLS